MRTLTRTTAEERRHLPLSTAGVAIRAAEGDTVAAGGERFIGYAAKFNSRTAIGNPLKWGFYEEIAPGAFTKTLQEGDARMLIDHDSYYVVSRVSAGTLALAEDALGLPVDSALDIGLSYVSDLKANVRNKNITGMSFGFYVVKDDWALEDVELNGQTAQVEVRRILEVRLIEVSAVTFPAYEDTEAELASVASALVSRGDQAAIEKRAKFRPELRDLLRLVGKDIADPDVVVPAAREAPELMQVEGEPGESTRETSTPETAPADADGTEPAETTRTGQEPRVLRMRGLAARYGLQRSSS
ncbi:HK97 family phage prohead protease [Streptomyces graminilatus]|uniref:HK97 family phage prohead protease n=1 Tax=Streptomyces graminilatus TaxID=1464070 RepID=UPI0006E17F6E|nr:HK97 family phage prohead protease [Streptomyces graminilatus]